MAFVVINGPNDHAPDPPNHVYVMACEGRTKVGIAVKPLVRRAQLQLACPFKISLVTQRLFANRLAAIAVEREIHAVLAEHRTYGEWFTVEPGRAVALLETFVEFSADAA